MNYNKKHFRRLILLIFLMSAALGSAAIGVGTGTVNISAGEVFRAVFSDDGSTARLLIWNLRLPRVLCGGLAGACLAVSGCILQCVMRNSMASPSTIGVTSSAAFFGYLLLAVIPGYADFLPVVSIIGAFLTSSAIYLLAYSRGASAIRIILAGMAVSAFFGALSDWIKLHYADSLGNVSGFLVGGFNGCTWDSLLTVLPYAAAGIVVCVFLPGKMNILMLGDENAASLGLPTGTFRFVLIAAASVLAGSAVALGGLVSFVGLIVPHTARLRIGSDSRYLKPASALLGFVLVTLCDTLGRVIMPPGEVPVSIILSLIGAPFFIWLLRSREKGV
ncbi:MAG: iron ABC transporter permease [Clostridia bacterium]|nr:iron ABC transporter permease [Clostridia bacterium]